MKLNETAYEQARKLIRAGKAVIDERDDWSEHQPTAAEENDFIGEHGWREYAKWHLGIDEEHAEETKERYAFPYGDFRKVQPLRPAGRGVARRSVQVPGHRARGPRVARDDGGARQGLIARVFDLERSALFRFGVWRRIRTDS